MHRDFWLERPSVHQLPQDFAVNKFHHDVGNRNIDRHRGDEFFSGVVDPDDVRMAHSAHRVGFPLEAIARFGIGCHVRAKRLYRDPALQPSVRPDVHIGHAAASDQRLGPIALGKQER